MPKVFSNSTRCTARPTRPTCCSSFDGSVRRFCPRRHRREMTSIGTLFAFILVCGCVDHASPAGPTSKRRLHGRPRCRSWRRPALCLRRDDLRARTNWLRLIGWLVLGLVFYFGYGRATAASKARRDPIRAASPWLIVSAVAGSTGARPALFAVALLAGASATGLGYMVIEGWSSGTPSTCPTVITITTVGYREVHGSRLPARCERCCCCSAVSDRRSTSSPCWPA